VNELGLPVLALISILGCGLVTAQDHDFSKVQMKVSKVAGNVYMVEGAGGNIGASVGDDGIVVVDDQYAPLADKIQAALKGITDKPVRFIINTHYHPDHTGSNEYFQKQAPIIAHDNVRKRLEAGGPAGNGGSLHMEFKPQPKEALPILTFDHDVTVHLNGEDIRALYFPAGHTDGDSIIFFPKSNVVHMGDDFVTYGFPFIDVDSGGSINGMIDAVEKSRATAAGCKDHSRAWAGLQPGRRAGVLDHAEGHAGRGRECPEREQDAGSDEAGEIARSVEEILRRLRQRRCVSGNALQLAHRTEERKVRQTQLMASVS
jgi:glyoxylase-like metal-dependent hydrolase (beta-lactamase superfamily II)